MRRTALFVFALGSVFMLVSPEASLQQTRVSVEAPFSPDPRRIPVRAGGNVPLSQLELDNDTCDYGYVSDVKDGVELEYEDELLRDLYVYAESDQDIMLILETPLGEILCDDDSHEGLNPMVHVDLGLPGTYTIFVGTYSSSSVESATLFLSLTDPTGGSSSSELSMFSEPTFGRATLAAGFTPDPHNVSLTAGGGVEVDVSGCDYGYVASAPDYNVTFSGTGNLHVFARSDTDIMLLINTASGQWLCDDDSLGEGDPTITITGATAGLYNIWVGTYSEGGGTPTATLSISGKGAK